MPHNLKMASSVRYCLLLLALMMTSVIAMSGPQLINHSGEVPVDQITRYNNSSPHDNFNPWKDIKDAYARIVELEKWQSANASLLECAEDKLKEKDKERELEKQVCDLKLQLCERNASGACQCRVAALLEQLQEVRDQLAGQTNKSAQLEADLAHLLDQVDNLNASLAACDKNLKTCDNKTNALEKEKAALIKERDDIIKSILKCKGRGKGLEIVELNSGKYFFSGAITRNWTGAVSFCAANGMELLSIESPQENLAVINKIKLLGGLASHGSYYWTSGNDLATEGTFVWASLGVNFIYTDWPAGQPDNSGGIENCVYVGNYLGSYKWGDVACDKMAPFICEMPSYCSNRQVVLEV